MSMTDVMPAPGDEDPRVPRASEMSQKGTNSASTAVCRLQKHQVDDRALQCNSYLEQ
jgi:hypothetical protein